MTVLAQQQDEQPEIAPGHVRLPPPSLDPTPAESPRGPAGAEASVSQLISQLSAQLVRLARAELALAELDAGKRSKRAGTAAGVLSLAMAAAFFGACCLLTAVVLAVSMVTRPWEAALSVGVILVIVAVLFAAPALWSLRRAKRDAGRQSVRSLKADIAALRVAAHR